jgi:hypothetical protein
MIRAETAMLEAQNARLRAVIAARDARDAAQAALNDLEK